MIALGRIELRSADAVLEARRKIRALGVALDMGPIEATRLATITSKLGRRLYREGRDAFVAAELDLQFRVFASAPWPRGSDCVFASATDLRGSLDEIARRGVWWEVGRRHEVPGELDHLCSPEFGVEAAEVLEGLLPIYERIAGDLPAGD